MARQPLILRSYAMNEPQVRLGLHTYILYYICIQTDVQIYTNTHRYISSSGINCTYCMCAKRDR